MLKWSLAWPYAQKAENIKPQLNIYN